MKDFNDELTTTTDYQSFDEAYDDDGAGLAAAWIVIFALIGVIIILAAMIRLLF